MSSSFEYSWGKPLITIDNVVKSYDGNPVLKGISAQILDVIRPGMTAGQIICILGPSGIGKTTLFNILSGLKKPDSGQVFIGPEQHPVHSRDIGVVAQDYPLLEHRTVFGNLSFAARLKGHNRKDADSVATDMLKDFELSEHASKYPIQLSGGQRQRIAIAQQLICSKYYLIMDEPFSGLDVVALGKVRDMIISVANKNENNTFIITTHDVTSAVNVADIIWLLGRERDSSGNVVPGARIIEKIDLIEQNVAWQQIPSFTQQGISLIQYIKQRFESL